MCWYYLDIDFSSKYPTILTNQSKKWENLMFERIKGDYELIAKIRWWRDQKRNVVIIDEILFILLHFHEIKALYINSIIELEAVFFQ